MTRWNAVPLTEPAVEPVSVEEGVRHMRLLSSVSSPEWQHVRDVLAAARQHVEGELRRQLVSADWRLELGGFPSADGEILLPRPPAQSVLAVKWEGRQGGWQTLSDWRFRISNGIGRVLPQANGWPAGAEAVRVDFRAGYGDSPQDVPMPIRQAILLWASALYEQPDAQTDSPFTFKENPAADRLLAPHRIGDFP